MVVTGATGHIGNVLVRELVGRGQPVRAVLLPGEDTEPLDGLRVEVVRADVRDPAALSGAFQGADVVYHLAALIALGAGRGRQMHEVNVLGTRNVVAAARAAGVRRLVYTSSVHALVEPPHGTPICERAGFEPDRVVGGYGKSKAQATLEVLRGVAEGLDAVIVMPTGVMGPYDFRGSEMGQLVVDFARRQLPAFVDGAYDFVDVRDVAQGLIAAAERGRRGECYLLSGEPISVRALLAHLAELTAVRPPRTRLPLRVAQTFAVLASLYYLVARARPRFTLYSLHTLRSNCAVDSNKARRELGFAPRPLAQTIADTVCWFRANGRFDPPPPRRRRTARRGLRALTPSWSATGPGAPAGRQ